MVSEQLLLEIKLFQKFLHSHCSGQYLSSPVNTIPKNCSEIICLHYTKFFQIQGLKYDASCRFFLPHPIYPLALEPPPTSCCPGCNIPFCTLSLSHSLLETGARRLKTHSFSWDFHLFAPSSLPLLCVNISWAQGGGKALAVPVHTAVYREKQEFPSQGQLYQGTGENLRYKGFT